MSGLSGMAFARKVCTKCRQKKDTKGSSQKRGSNGRPVFVCGDCVQERKVAES